MYIEQLSLTNFRCFGPGATTIDLMPGLTAFIGVNGAGKTAVLQALQRLFGITGEQRRLRRQDFHVPAAERRQPSVGRIQEWRQRSVHLRITWERPELPPWPTCAAPGWLPVVKH